MTICIIYYILYGTWVGLRQKRYISEWCKAEIKWEKPHQSICMACVYTILCRCIILYIEWWNNNNNIINYNTWYYERAFKCSVIPVEHDIMWNENGKSRVAIRKKIVNLNNYNLHRRERTLYSRASCVYQKNVSIEHYSRIPTRYRRRINRDVDFVTIAYILCIGGKEAFFLTSPLVHIDWKKNCKYKTKRGIF